MAVFIFSSLVCITKENTQVIDFQVCDFLSPPSSKGRHQWSACSPFFFFISSLHDLLPYTPRFASFALPSRAVLLPHALSFFHLLSTSLLLLLLLFLLSFFPPLIPAEAANSGFTVMWDAKESAAL